MSEFISILGQIVYILCGLTSLGCMLLLINRYRQTKVELLFWSALAFFFLTCTNILLFIDIVLLPKFIDLSIVRNIVTLASVVVLLYGLIKGNTK
jgi:hypothetical protein